MLLLPADPDAVAARAARRGSPARARGAAVGVVLSDTAGRPWRVGQTDFALGAAGAARASTTCAAAATRDGKPLEVTERASADEVAAAADLVKGKAAGVPAALVRGARSGGAVVRDTPGARALVRTGPTDWFGSGRVEAVRASLGVEAGTELAREVGIPSALPEPPATRVARARRVALLGVEGVSASPGPRGSCCRVRTPSPSAWPRRGWWSPCTARGWWDASSACPRPAGTLQARVKTT